MALYHAYSQTVADGTATSVVRPSDWNSGHNQFVTLAGNTAGVSTISGTNIVYQGGNNVTLSGTGATIIVNGANTVAQTVQTQASGAIAGTGFTSTSTAGSLITAAMGTNGLSMAVPAYLTTYANDLTSGRAGTGFTSTTTAGTAVTAALGTNGLSMAVPAYITTYANDLTSGRAGTGYTSTTQGGSTVGVTQNTAGLSMAWPPFLTTAAAAQTVQTQAAGSIAGIGYTSTTQGGSTVGATLNTNGFSAAWPLFITTYANDLTSGRAGTGFTSTTTAGTAVTAALGTNGLSMAVPNYLTTYINDLTSGRAGTGFTSTSTAGVAITAALGTNGLSMAVPNYITTYVNDLTSGRAGTGFTSTTTAGTAITAALGTNGLNMAVPNYLTTYAAQTTQTQAAGNIAGNGYTSTTQAGTTVGLTQGTNGLSVAWPPFITAATGGGGGGIGLAVAGSTLSDGTALFSNANGVTFGMNGSTVTASIIPNATYDGWTPYSDLMMVAGQQGQGTLYFEPEHAPYYFQDRVGVPIAYTNATNSTGSVTLSYWMGFYTQNASTLSLSASTSFSTALTFSGTVGSYSRHSGMRLLTFPWAQTVPEGEVWIGHLSRTTSGGANASISQMLISNINSNFVGFFGQAHTTTQQWTLGQGVYSATTSGMPNSVAFSQIRGSDSLNLRAPAVMFINGTV